MSDKDNIYITTAIGYINGDPHIGHAYEAISADVLARYHRLQGRNVFFMTGTDEHGDKVEKSFMKKYSNGDDKKLLDKEKLLAYCGEMSLQFKDMGEKLMISYDKFIRTTDQDHYETAKYLFNQAYDKGDIYLGEYKGWYSIREESFVPEHEAMANNYKDVVSGVPYSQLSEPSYFFSMEKYRLKLIDYINNNPEFISNPLVKNHILSRLQSPLIDLSISRTTCQWGIPIPKKSNIHDDKNHVMYVWFDALTNYLTGVNSSESKLYNWDRYGRPIHIIGLDIAWFHAVIWPCMLMSVGLELPKALIIHGFVTDVHGLKMSKSLGNTISPKDLYKYGSDVVRYYLMKAGYYGTDVHISEDDLKTINDSDLADNYGNLINRVFALCKKNSDSKVHPICLEFKANLINEEFVNKIDMHMQNGHITESLVLIVGAINHMNDYLQKMAPWKSSLDSYKRNITTIMLGKIYAINHYMSIFCPLISQIIFDRLRHPPIKLKDLITYNLKDNTIIDCDPLILFHKFNPKLKKSKSN